METKTCVGPEYGGCGKTKSLEYGFPIAKPGPDGKPAYRPRCKVCMTRWKTMTEDERRPLRIPREYTRQDMTQEFRTCVPVENGGCGEKKRIEEFSFDKARADGTRIRLKRCKKCQSRIKQMTREERRKIVKLRAVYEMPKVENKPMDCPGAYFFVMPVTDCERNYWEVGRA